MISGRIIKGVGGLYIVACGNEIYECRARGLFKHENISPVVGDFVKISIIDEEAKKGYIQEIEERKNELFRPKIANVDYALVVFSMKSPKIDLMLLDVFTVIMEYNGIEPIICINKSELAKETEVEEIRHIYETVGYKVFMISAINGNGIDELKKELFGKVTVITGPSGVGKSSLINAICPRLTLETGEISRKLARGKHTTRHTSLIRTAEKTYLADTPGFTSLTIEFICKENLSLYFKEIKEMTGECKFNNCLHLHEPGCTVKERAGMTIPSTRYLNYKYLLEEKIRNE